MTQTLTATTGLTLPVQERVLILECAISMFGNSKKDKKGTETLKQQHNVKDGRSNASKTVLDPAALAGGVAIQQKLRQLIYRNTVPYDKNGRSMIPTSLWFNKVAAEARTLESEFYDWVDKDFMPNYLNHKTQAEYDLNDSYDEADYPDPARMRKKFAFKIHTSLFPDYSKLSDAQKTVFGADELEHMEKQMKERIEAAVTGSLITRLSKSLLDPENQNNPGIVVRLKNFQERVILKDQGVDVGKKGFFKDSLIENVQEEVEIIPTLNITDDPIVQHFVERVEKEVCAYPASTLRVNDNLRSQVIASAEDILDKMSYYQ